MTLSTYLVASRSIEVLKKRTRREPHFPVACLQTCVPYSVTIPGRRVMIAKVPNNRKCTYARAGENYIGGRMYECLERLTHGPSYNRSVPEYFTIPVGYPIYCKAQPTCLCSIDQARISSLERYIRSTFSGSNLGMRAWRGVTGSKPLHRTFPPSTRCYWRTTEATKRIGSITEQSVAKAHGKLGDLVQSSAKSDEHLGEVEIEGYVRSIRKQKRVAFAAVGDGSNLQPVQAVLEPSQAES